MDAQDIMNFVKSLAIALVLVAVSYGLGEVLIRPTDETVPMAAVQAKPEPVKAAAPQPVAAPAAEPTATPTPAPVETVAARVATADPAMGEKAFRLCKACHTAKKDGKNRVGPNLWDVVGRKQGSLEGFNYSDAFGRLDGDWTYKALDTFLKNPRIFVVGTRMSIKGLKDADKRAALIAYLHSLSDAPKPLP